MFYRNPQVKINNENHFSFLQSKVLGGVRGYPSGSGFWATKPPVSHNSKETPRVYSQKKMWKSPGGFSGFPLPKMIWWWKVEPHRLLPTTRCSIWSARKMAVMTFQKGTATIYHISPCISLKNGRSQSTSESPLRGTLASRLKRIFPALRSRWICMLSWKYFTAWPTMI